MALKEKALRRLAEKMAKKNIPWCAEGDWARSMRDPSTSWHGFDILVAAADLEKADQVLTRLGMREEAPDALHFHFDGADITLRAADDLAPLLGETVDVLGEKVILAKGE